MPFGGPSLLQKKMSDMKGCSSNRQKRGGSHDDRTALRALEPVKFASAWCTPADAGNLRKVSRTWHGAFEHTPDEVTMTRIELQHAEYFARMAARYWSRPNCMSRPLYYRRRRGRPVLTTAFSVFAFLSYQKPKIFFLRCCCFFSVLWPVAGALLHVSWSFFPFLVSATGLCHLSYVNAWLARCQPSWT